MRTLDDLTWAPQMFGKPFYPAGFPVNEEKFVCDGKTIRALKLELFRMQAATIPGDKEKLEILFDWFPYYVHAPCWAQWPTEEFEAWKEKSLNLKTVNELMDWAIDGLDYGMDVL